MGNGDAVQETVDNGKKAVDNVTGDTKGIEKATNIAEESSQSKKVMSDGLGNNVNGSNTSQLKIDQLPIAKPGEDLYVGSYSKSTYWNKKTGLNKTHTPHHAVQDAVSPTTHGKGVTINLDRGLHAQTDTFCTSRKLANDRQHLAADVYELKDMLKGAGYDRSTINAQLNQLIKQNLATGGFNK